MTKHCSKGVSKVIIEEGNLDWKFIDEHVQGFEDWKQNTESLNWESIVVQSGIEQQRIVELGQAVSKSKNLIICWAMGITQHENAVATIQEASNILLAGGHFGRPGAGACPVRGHSNVQGASNRWHQSPSQRIIPGSM